LLSGHTIDRQIGIKQKQQIFASVVQISTLLRQNRITLYNIDPSGAGSLHFQWQSFVKGLTKPTQTEYGDMALQVIATQSGGLVVSSDNEIFAALQQCLAETQAYYELSFAPPEDNNRDEYHSLEVQVNQATVPELVRAIIRNLGNRTTGSISALDDTSAVVEGDGPRFPFRRYLRTRQRAAKLEARDWLSETEENTELNYRRQVTSETQSVASTVGGHISPGHATKKNDCEWLRLFIGAQPCQQVYFGLFKSMRREQIWRVNETVARRCD
jgi:hypothetical protein